MIIVSEIFQKHLAALQHLLISYRAFSGDRRGEQTEQCISSGWCLITTNNTILVVDDNPTSLALVSFLLRRDGKYEVLSTPDPSRALEIVRTNPSLDIVVSDVEMPVLRGPQLVQEIKQTAPAVGCVLMSATTDCAEQLPPNVPLLSKPINAAELFAAVELVLSESMRAAAQLGETLGKGGAVV